MRTIMNRNYNEDYLFHPRQSYHLAAQVSEEIKNSIKLMNFDRYSIPFGVIPCLIPLPAQIPLHSVGYRWRAAHAGPLLHGQLSVGCREGRLCHLLHQDTQIHSRLHRILFVLRLSACLKSEFMKIIKERSSKINLINGRKE